jgi:FemAB-related protein (PEP-CTERM system-associated)
MKIKIFKDSKEALAELKGYCDELDGFRPSPIWWNALGQGFGHRSYCLSGCDSSEQAVGCLPLLFVRSLIFGKFLVSLPYLNSGGVLLEGAPQSTEPIAQALIDRAVQLADELDVKYLELRHEARIEHPLFNHERTDKVHMRLTLPATPELLMASFKSKLRSQIKKANENPFEVRFGGEELLTDFYKVFAHNMRDLGTPVYSKNLFRETLRSFANSQGSSKAELCVVRWNHRPISGALLIHHAHRTEVPSASAIRKFNFTNVNMWMYWQLLQRAIEQGSNEFDFGRSTIGAGTYKFKEQWGAKPSLAVWQYYVRKGDPAQMRPDSSKNQRLVEIWKKLPVWLTRIVGPSIVRGIP